MENIAKELYEIESEITRLEGEKSTLTLKKRDMESKLRKLNNRVRTGGLLPNDEYRWICKTQEALKDKIRKIEDEVQPISAEIKQWNSMATELRIKAGKFNRHADLDGVMRSFLRMFGNTTDLAKFLESRYG